eukprot:1613167-Rhodomonas_salina.1
MTNSRMCVFIETCSLRGTGRSPAALSGYGSPLCAGASGHEVMAVSAPDRQMMGSLVVALSA